jgi:DNA-directed RNA polymerase-3 subunit RPC5
LRFLLLPKTSTNFFRFTSVMDFDHDSDDDRPENERGDVSEPNENDSNYCSDSDDSDDPVVRTLPFVINETPEVKELFIFQWAGIEKGKPIPAVKEVRIKWKSGFVEVDVPIPKETLMSDQYDRVAAIKYGEALRKTKDLGQTAYGAAAGFERKLPRSTKRKDTTNDEDLDDDAGEDPASASAAAPVEEDDNLEKYLANYEDAIDKGHVLQTTTWSGRIYEADEAAGWDAIGVVRDNMIHFNPVTAIVQLHPQATHHDAQRHLELNMKHQAAAAEPKQDGDEEEEDDDQVVADEEWLDAWIHGPSNEAWDRYPWVNEESEAAYASFEERMFLADDKQILLEFESVKSYSQRMLPRVIPRGRPVPAESDSDDWETDEEEVEEEERWVKREEKEVEKVEVEEEQEAPAPTASLS